VSKSWTTIFITLLFILVFFVFNCDGEEYWQQHVHYKIYAKLITDQHLIQSNAILVYRNNSPDTLTSLYFHLYPNAFQKNSLMAKEARQASVEIITTPQEQGWIKIDSLVISKTGIPIGRLPFQTFLQGTILKIALGQALLPDEQLTISLQFRTKIRQFNYFGGKGGYSNNFYEISQWYPKVCVYDKNGWDATPYHWLGEFYGEFGTFDVTLDVPDSFIVAGTGEVAAGDPGWHSVQIDSNGNRLQSERQFILAHHRLDSQATRRVVTFHAEQVHDFVWTTSPDYLYQTGQWGNIPIHVLFRRASRSQWHNVVLKNARYALSWLNELIGEYPYPCLTVCQGLLSGGMEYPMVTVLGHTDLTLTVHEITHMYFYGALANNEATEGWLDEGIVTYLSESLVQRYAANQAIKYAPPLFIHFPFITAQFDSISARDLKLNSLYYYFYSGFEQPISTPCFKLTSKYLYTYNVYLKPSRFFGMLEYLVGRENFVRILRTYYQEWKFRHVNRRVFQQVCERVTGRKLDWFFDQWIDETPRIDYACGNVKSHQQPDGRWKTAVTIKRLGTGVMPVETQVITMAGDTMRKRWAGNAPKGVVTFMTPSKVTRYQLDPDDIILDQNRCNNSSFRPQFFLYPDFVSMYYLPRNSYSVFYWPRVWYNDVDGFKLGIKIFGGYLNRYYITRDYFWYGFRSHKFDCKFSYSMPWERINRNLWRHIYLLKMEGRTELNVNINYNHFKKFAALQAHVFRLGFIYQYLNEPEYTYHRFDVGNKAVKVQEWSKGTIAKLYFSCQTRSLPGLDFNFNGQISHKVWGSDFNYVRLALSNQWTRTGILRSGTLKIRFFIGYSYHPDSRVPLQEMFHLAQAGPNQRFNYYYLRSAGSMPYWLHYHLPGDGNLRGYLNKIVGNDSPLAGNKLATLNIDFVKRNFQRLFPRKMQGLVQGIDLNLFFDMGRIWVNGVDAKYLCDAGIGVKFYKIILGKRFHVQFPLFLNKPVLDKYTPPESRWKFRWIVSFQ